MIVIAHLKYLLTMFFPNITSISNRTKIFFCTEPRDICDLNYEIVIVIFTPIDVGMKFGVRGGAQVRNSGKVRVTAGGGCWLMAVSNSCQS